MKTRVVLVDDHAGVRQMMGMTLAREGPYEIVGEAGTGFEALKVCRKLRPQLLILDLLLPELSGAEVLRTVRAEMRESRVIVYSGTHNRELILETLQARPHGFVHKCDPFATFREALRAVAAGCSFFTPFATKLLDGARATSGAPAVLTGRERAVLQMLAEGMSNKEIADRLEVSPKTVEHHRAHLMEKLDLHDVAKLTRYAMRAGLVEG